MATGIKVEHSVPHVHTQNGLAEALIKRIKFISRPLLQGCNLPTTCSGHTVLYAANLINFRPSVYNIHYPMALAQGSAPVPGSAMGPPRNSRIYIGYETVSIIRFLDPMSSDCHTTCFVDCIFDEDLFPTLGGGNQPLDDKSREIMWQATGTHAHDRALLALTKKSKR
jgi:hypothetical protein